MTDAPTRPEPVRSVDSSRPEPGRPTGPTPLASEVLTTANRVHALLTASDRTEGAERLAAEAEQ